MCYSTLQHVAVSYIKEGKIRTCRLPSRRNNEYDTSFLVFTRKVNCSKINSKFHLILEIVYLHTKAREWHKTVSLKLCWILESLEEDFKKLMPMSFYRQLNQDSLGWYPDISIVFNKRFHYTVNQFSKPEDTVSDNHWNW
jgi:hypothetical protein